LADRGAWNSPLPAVPISSFFILLRNVESGRLRILAAWLQLLLVIRNTRSMWCVMTSFNFRSSTRSLDFDSFDFQSKQKARLPSLNLPGGSRLTKGECNHETQERTK
jgi:hypothetical protein